MALAAEATIQRSNPLLGLTIRLSKCTLAGVLWLKSIHPLGDFLPVPVALTEKSEHDPSTKPSRTQRAKQKIKLAKECQGVRPSIARQFCKEKGPHC